MHTLKEVTPLNLSKLFTTAGSKQNQNMPHMFTNAKNVLNSTLNDFEEVKSNNESKVIYGTIEPSQMKDFYPIS